MLLLVLSGCAIALDQFAAPLLRSSSPVWASATCLLLVWRRSHAQSLLPDGNAVAFRLSLIRLAGFLAGHGAIVLAARALQGTLQPAAGTVTLLGTLIALGKLGVLFPTILLLPLSEWKSLLQSYRAECVASLVVLFTYFPGRVIEGLWPWYGPALGRFVYAISAVFVPGLVYAGGSNPTLLGRYLDVTIVLDCSGRNGIELFDYLFGAMTVLDWNRFRKGRLFAGYFLGLLAMLLGNALRISSLVVFGNRGFAATVARYHISAGWIFFSIVFLIYLALTFGWMLKKKAPLPAKTHPDK